MSLAARPRGTVLSAEPTTSTQPTADEHVETCVACGAALAADQRYCLECGERRATMSSVLLAGLPGRDQTQASEPPSAPPTPPGPVSGGSPAGGEPRSAGLVTVLAGIGVLLLAMGVGVLIGRSGSSSSKAPAAAPEVISVPAPSTAGTSAAPAAEASFSSDWPAGTSGYTVQLQTLRQSGTQVSAVESAKSSASTKGAKSVGALKSEEFSSLPAGEYVIYSGVYHQRSQAQTALASLKKSFPGASVIKVSSGSSSSSSSGSSGSEASGSSSHGSSGTGSSENHPAPPSVVEHLNKKKGQSYEQESKNLPNVISTG